VGPAQPEASGTPSISGAGGPELEFDEGLPGPTKEHGRDLERLDGPHTPLISAKAGIQVRSFSL
jgi:hypothetical protein